MTQFKVAILSDIHGFSLALDRVLEDIDRHNPDRVVVAGDLIETGPDPVGVLDRLRDSSFGIIQGNTDADLGNRALDSKLAGWTLVQIGEEGCRWLAELPFDERISPPGGRSQNDDLLVVHANPFDQLRAIAPDADADDLDDLIGDTQAAVLAFGHIHIAYIRELPGMTLLDVSAVGNPKDGDLRSKWGMATWDEAAHRWDVELHYVNYPLDETVQQMLESGMPNVDKHIRKLKRASYA